MLTTANSCFHEISAPSAPTVANNLGRYGTSSPNEPFHCTVSNGGSRNPSCSSDYCHHSSHWRASRVAVQRRLGLLPGRRLGHDSCNPLDPGAVRRHLTSGPLPSLSERRRQFADPIDGGPSPAPPLATALLFA